MELLNMNAMQPNQSSYTEAHHNYADLAALSDLKVKAREDQASVLRPVAEQFEALFVQQILKESRKVSFDDNWLDGNQGDFYKDWYDKQLSLNLAAKGTLGFADNIVKQLSQGVPEMVKSTELEAEQARKQKELPSSTEDALALRFTKKP